MKIETFDTIQKKKKKKNPLHTSLLTPFSSVDETFSKIFISIIKGELHLCYILPCVNIE